MGDVVIDLVEAVAGLGGLALLGVAFALAMGETAIFADLVVPGETGMILVGAAAARGGEPALPALIAVAAAGAVVGDSVSWAIGRRWGLRLVCRWEPVRKRVEPEVARAQRYFDERGGLAIVVGRFVGALRAVVPAVAGMSGMPYRRFLPWNIVASAAWTSAIVTLGYVLGRHITTVADNITTIITGVVLAALAAWLWRRHRKRDTGEDADDHSGDAERAGADQAG